jgi:transposase
LNVLKSHLQVTIRTLLQRGASQREIERATGVDRKTIRRYEQQANSPGVATGSEPVKTGGGPDQIPPYMDAPLCQALFRVSRSQEEIAAIHPASVCSKRPRALMEYAGRRPITPADF